VSKKPDISDIAHEYAADINRILMPKTASIVRDIEWWVQRAPDANDRAAVAEALEALAERVTNMAKQVRGDD